jgi:hypothetical protein
VLKVADTKLRTKLDRQYRSNPRYRKFFLQGYEFITTNAQVINANDLHVMRWSRCYNAVISSKWLDPAGRDLLEVMLRQRRER